MHLTIEPDKHWTIFVPEGNQPVIFKFQDGELFSLLSVPPAPRRAYKTYMEQHPKFTGVLELTVSRTATIGRPDPKTLTGDKQ